MKLGHSSAAWASFTPSHTRWFSFEGEIYTREKKYTEAASAFKRVLKIKGHQGAEDG
jgi:hypothetical protein